MKEKNKKVLLFTIIYLFVSVILSITLGLEKGYSIIGGGGYSYYILSPFPILRKTSVGALPPDLEDTLLPHIEFGILGMVLNIVLFIIFLLFICYFKSNKSRKIILLGFVILNLLTILIIRMQRFEMINHFF